jgi:hypothetical protein
VLNANRGRHIRTPARGFGGEPKVESNPLFRLRKFVGQAIEMARARGFLNRFAASLRDT